MNTTACSDCRALLGGYVLNALEPDEAESIRHHLATCDACAAEHGHLVGIPALLDVAGGVDVHTEQPPAALEEAVLDRFAQEAREAPDPTPRERRTRTRDRLAGLRRRLARPFPAALSGAAVAAAVTAALIVLPGGSGDSPSGSIYKATLVGSSAVPDASASAELQVFSAGTHVRLSVRDLHGQPDSVYELWCVRDDGVKISAGTFRTDSGGRADVSLTTAAVPGEYHRLSVERKAFANARNGGQLVMAGSIQYPRW